MIKDRLENPDKKNIVNINFTLRDKNVSLPIANKAGYSHFEKGNINYFPYSSFLANAVFVILPGRQPLVYNLCVNKIQASELDISTIKRNKLLIVIVMLSLILHLVVYIKIKTHKQKQNKSIYVISYSDHIKHIGISSIDNHSLSDFGISVTSVIFSLSVTSISTIANEMNPANVNKFPFYLFIYFNHFISINFLTFFISSIYYIKHPALRKTVKREINDWLYSIISLLSTSFN